MGAWLLGWIIHGAWNRRLARTSNRRGGRCRFSKCIRRAIGAGEAESLVEYADVAGRSGVRAAKRLSNGQWERSLPFRCSTRRVGKPSRARHDSCPDVLCDAQGRVEARTSAHGMLHSAGALAAAAAALRPSAPTCPGRLPPNGPAYGMILTGGAESWPRSATPRWTACPWRARLPPSATIRGGSSTSRIGRGAPLRCGREDEDAESNR